MDFTCLHRKIHNRTGLDVTTTKGSTQTANSNFQIQKKRNKNSGGAVCVFVRACVCLLARLGVCVSGTQAQSSFLIGRCFPERTVVNDMNSVCFFSLWRTSSLQSLCRVVMFFVFLCSSCCSSDSQHHIRRDAQEKREIYRFCF